VRSFASLLLCDFARNSLRSLRLCCSLKKDVGELRGCDRSFSVFSVSLLFVKKGCWEVEGVRSLFGKLRGGDRYLGAEGSAIAVWGVEGVRSLFREVEGMRSLYMKILFL
jgi:hypothetical protein